MDELKYILESITSSGSGYTLDTICRAASIKSTGMIKTKKIDALIEFYSSKNCILNIWNNLSPYEKELLTCYVQCGYKRYKTDFEKIAKKHGIVPSRYEYGSDAYITKTSTLNLFTINGNIPPFIRVILDKLIPPLEIKFKTVTEPPEHYDEIIGRESRLSDFDYLIRFINNQSVAATKAEGLMNKKSFLKYYDIVRYPELFNDDLDEIKDIRDIRDTIISHSIVQLLLNADILSISIGKFILGKYASHFLELDTASKAKFIYDAYQKHNSSGIDEITRIKANQFSMGKHYNPSPAVHVLIQYLAKCPVMTWVSMESYKDIIKKKDFNFLDVCTGNVLVKDQYYNTYYNHASWGELEYFLSMQYSCAI